MAVRWTVAETPMYPNSWKVLPVFGSSMRETNDLSNFFPTSEEARAECARRNDAADAADEAELLERLRSADVAERYYSQHHVIYDKDPDCYGCTTIEVLSFLNGLPFDNLAMAYIHGTHPYSIRATFGWVTCDSQPGRVTVYLKEVQGWDPLTKKPTPLIDRIQQEIRVRFGCGADIDAELRRRKTDILLAEADG